MTHYVGSRLTREARYTPGAKFGLLTAASRVLRQFTNPQIINENWWFRKLGFLTAYSNGATPWDTLRVMMVRNTDAGKGVGTQFVRFAAGFVVRYKYEGIKTWYHREYGRPIVSQRQSKLKHSGCLSIVTIKCANPKCGRCNDVVFETEGC